MSDPSKAAAGDLRSPSTSGRQYWDEWNGSWRFRADYDTFMKRQLEVATFLAREIHVPDMRILDVGCGTGWLGDALRPFGDVWGTDLSPGAIADGSQRYPAVNLICGDFLAVDIPGLFDLVVTADGLAHMPDHAACIDRISSVLKPGGMFLLMTENPLVWRRRSGLRPLPPSVPHASPEEWPSLNRIRGLLSRSFAIERVGSLEPGGDRGFLWWVENRYVRRSMGLLLGRQRWRSLLERMRLGRELVIIARRLSTE